MLPSARAASCVSDYDVSIPGFDIPAMITPQERTGLSLFAKAIEPDAAIVDAGTFLGSSTTALAHGLEQSDLSEAEQAGRIWAYDLFRATPGMNLGIAKGGSFRPMFDRYVAPVNSKLRVFEGDILSQPVPDQPIGVLFVDIMWSYDSAFHIARRFYPKLRPLRSVMIHQDFVYPFYPWVIIHLGLMDQYLRPAYNIPHSSMVFDVMQEIPESAVPEAKKVEFELGRAQYEKFLPYVDGWGKGALLLSLALYAAEKGRLDEARQRLTDIEATYGREPLVTQYFPFARTFIAEGGGREMTGGA